MIKFPHNPLQLSYVGDNLKYLLDIMLKSYDAKGEPIVKMRSYCGTVHLVSGKAEVVVPHGGFINWFTVSITPDTSTVDYRYGVDFHSGNKFVIHSSDTGDTTEVRWLAIGY